MRTDRVQYQTKQLLGFISKGVGRYQKMTFSTKVPESRPTDSQRQARRGYWPVAKARAINSVTTNSTGYVRGRLLAVCVQGRHRLAGSKLYMNK